MKTKLMMLGLLAAAPMASQAAMVEMDDAALSKVEGQAFTFNFDLNPALGFNFSNDPDTYSHGYIFGVRPTTEYYGENNDDPTRNVTYSRTFIFGGLHSFERNKGTPVTPAP